MPVLYGILGALIVVGLGLSGYALLYWYASQFKD